MPPPDPIEDAAPNILCAQSSEQKHIRNSLKVVSKTFENGTQNRQNPPQEGPRGAPRSRSRKIHQKRKFSHPLLGAFFDPGTDFGGTYFSTFFGFPPGDGFLGFGSPESLQN